MSVSADYSVRELFLNPWEIFKSFVNWVAGGLVCRL
jgi:hypothetical protein